MYDGGGTVKRARATELLGEMLRHLDSSDDWPLNLVDAVYLFGSYARGALEPNDVDVAVDFRQDEQMHERFVAYLVSSGRDPRIDLRQALIGRRRGVQFQCGSAERQELEKDGVKMMRLWSRGDTLDQAMTVLNGIAEDPEAGRAERDDMIEEFEGLDRHIPRPVRSELISWRDAGKLNISRLTVTDTQTMPAGKEMAWAIDSRWAPDSPLRRAALAALAHMQGLGADLSDIELAGYRLPTPERMAGKLTEPRWWINWKWRNYQAIPHCLADGDGWLEILNPTRSRPLNALQLTPGSTEESAGQSGT